jgi:hypothetical protein
MTVLMPLFIAMAKPLLWLLPVLLLGAVVKSPWFKGWLGEQKVRELIRRRLDPAVYREFSNVTVRVDGETTQIDHVYVSPYGVFVIETKHMGHWIFGSRNQSQWTQKIYRNNIRFQNPLHQNKRHIRALEALLGLPADVFKSVVVFTGDSTFKNEMPDEVCTCSDLIEYIRSIDTLILSDERVGRICDDLQNQRLEPTFRTHREHVASLRRRHGQSHASVPRGQQFLETAAHRLLEAAEDRVRSGGRRQASRVVRTGLGLMAAKAAIALFAMFLIWWGFTTAVGGIAHSLQQPQQTAAAPVPAPALAPVPAAIPAARVEPLALQARQTIYREPTAAEIAESQRLADEAMRVLAPTTPEVPLTLPSKAQ